MKTSPIPWFPWIRRWLNERTGPTTNPKRARKLHLETLEERTGLSVVPGTVVALGHHRQQSTELPALITPLTPVTDAQVITDADLNAGIDAPPASPDLEKNAFNPMQPSGGDHRLEQEPFQNQSGDQPASITTVLNDTAGTPQKPTLLARTTYEALAQAVNERDRSNIPKTDSYFQIQRTPVTQQALQVEYEVRAYTNGVALARQQSAVFAAGSGQIDVTDLQLPLSQSNVEIVTLTLHAQKQYQIAQPAATIIIANSAQLCSEEALLRASQEGKSAEAMTALVEMHRPRVLQTCYGVLGNMADAEDACQLVFIMFAQQHYKLQQTVGRWLHTVARNVAISFLRARQRRRRHEQKAQKAELLTTSANDELREEIDQALTQLPLPLRQAVKLRYLDGWSQEEAAEILGWPRGTLAQRAARGLQALRKLMSPMAEAKAV